LAWTKEDRERRYRELYWLLNEYQIIGNLEETDEYKNTVWEMENLVAWLGYTPEA
jgi:hypothetical protein